MEKDPGKLKNETEKAESRAKKSKRETHLRRSKSEEQKSVKLDSKVSDNSLEEFVKEPTSSASIAELCSERKEEKKSFALDKSADLEKELVLDNIQNQVSNIFQPDEPGNTTDDGSGESEAELPPNQLSYGMAAPYDPSCTRREIILSVYRNPRTIETFKMLTEAKKCDENNTHDLLIQLFNKEMIEREQVDVIVELTVKILKVKEIEISEALLEKEIPKLYTHFGVKLPDNLSKVIKALSTCWQKKEEKRLEKKELKINNATLDRNDAKCYTRPSRGRKWYWYITLLGFLAIFIYIVYKMYAVYAAPTDPTCDSAYTAQRETSDSVDTAPREITSDLVDAAPIKPKCNCSSEVHYHMNCYSLIQFNFRN